MYLLFPSDNNGFIRSITFARRLEIRKIRYLKLKSKQKKL